MPQVFKTLATITVWLLFAWGCLTLFTVSVTYGFKETPGLGMYVGHGLGVACLFLSVVAAKLRQMME